MAKRLVIYLRTIASSIRRFPDEKSGLRNRLIHEYFGIDFDILKGILADEIAELRTGVIHALSELGAAQ